MFATVPYDPSTLGGETPDTAPAPPASMTISSAEAAAAHGFAISLPGAGAGACRDVHGFDDALVSAEDPRAPTPARLVLVAPDERIAAWLERWAEDVEQVRRQLTVRRSDGAEITLVATLAAFGDGVPTSLAVESIRPLSGRAILRSGVHPRAEVEAALALSPEPGP